VSVTGSGLDTTVTCASCGPTPAGLPFVHVGTGTGTYDTWTPPLGNGETRAPANNSDTELLLNADIEPDADTDGFGDETQDQCPTNSSTHGPCPTPAPPAATDTTAPVLSGLLLTNRIFKVDKSGSAATTPQGTVIRYQLSEAATVAFSVQKVTRGRRSKGKCRPRARKGKRCKIYQHRGSFNSAGLEGRNERIFSGKIGPPHAQAGLLPHGADGDGRGWQQVEAENPFVQNRPALSEPV
jgi:hypothetical protein